MFNKSTEGDNISKIYNKEINLFKTSRSRKPTVMKNLFESQIKIG